MRFSPKVPPRHFQTGAGGASTMADRTIQQVLVDNYQRDVAAIF